GPTMLSSAFSPESLADARLKEFETLLDRAAQKDDFVGLAVAVVRGGDVEMLRTYGVQERGGSEPVTPHTVFRIASLSKGFAASLAAVAMDDGLIAPNTPISPYAPRYTLKGGAQNLVTIEEVLSHRVGLPPNAYDNLLEAGVPVDDILYRYRSVAPICKVGTCYAYQNVSYNLIGDVLASLYDAPYEQIVRERLFQPLGMTDASLGRAGLSAHGDWARPHSRDRIPGEANAFTPWRVADLTDAYYRVPAAGGVNASVTDMARWLAAQMGDAPDVLPASALERIHTPLVETRAETRRWRSLASRITGTQYGMGWRIYQYAGETVVNHSGGVEGYGAQIAFLPDRDIGIVILANTRAKRVFRILPAFLDIELGLEGEDWLELTHEPADDAGELEELSGAGE
ncbi:MAG: serine hydrolase domain-containing protein, partial [Amphiplicatus sp.]